MKIEKINDRQIRCTLSAEDLAKRKLKLSEFAYGSEKANRLFHDILNTATEKLGFEGEDVPIVIEAIPTSPTTLVLVFTKVDDPEELDVRFSRFTPNRDEDVSADDGEEAEEAFSSVTLNGDEDIIEEEPEEEPQSPVKAVGGILDELREIVERERKKNVSRKKPDGKSSAYRTFVFNDLDGTTDFCKIIFNSFKGRSSLYKDPQSRRYFLVLFMDDIPLDEFNAVCNVGCEYATVIGSNALAFYKEYYKEVAKDDAVHRLVELMK
ncbi:MAG: adaptor protein MecA [Lachnospiraceae bacterium]|nr:adaptor protein MecA [Lachnospiraceae bacterium]